MKLKGVQFILTILEGVLAYVSALKQNNLPILKTCIGRTIAEPIFEYLTKSLFLAILLQTR